MTRLGIVGAFLVAFAACQPAQHPPTDAGDGGDPIVAACAKLTCATGGSACVAAMRKDQGQVRAAQMDALLACLVAASSSAEANACQGACGP